MSYTQILYHIVFATHKREAGLATYNRPKLYEYIWGVLKNKDCHLYRINGVEDHVHILCSLHSNIALSELVKSIKVASSGYIKQDNLFPDFTRWQEGYSAFTCSFKDKEGIIRYIQHQEEHHREVTFIEELEAMLNAAGIEYDPKHLG